MPGAEIYENAGRSFPRPSFIVHNFMAMTLDEKLQNLPAQPGCYLHKDARGEIIYVGKAKSLRSRVRQYFQSSRAMDAKTQELVSRIVDFEFIVTDTEVEALVLESNLIKQ